MATEEAMLSRLRLELGDFVQPFQAVFDGDGTTTRIALPEEAIIVSSETPFSVADSDGASVSYTLNADYGILTLSAPIATTDLITVDGYHAEVFTATHLHTFLRTAFALHNVRRHPPATYANLDEAEEYAIVLKSKLQGLWVLATDASRDIDIITTEGVRVPRSQRFSQLMAMIAAVQREYDDLVANLNVGVSRIEMMTLRRKSRTTNRLVSVYLPREVDDTRPPIRVYSPIDTEGAQMPIPSVEVGRLQAKQGVDLVVPLQFFDTDGNPRDLTNHADLKAKLFRARFQGTDQATFSIDTGQMATGIVTLTLSRDDITKLAPEKEYVWNLTWDTPEGDTDVVVAHGTLVVEATLPYKSNNVRW
jgi:hypothetical protein